jgi:hypothetical protein
MVKIRVDISPSLKVRAKKISTIKVSLYAAFKTNAFTV